MRTTLSLEADVAQRLRQELASGKKSLKQVINERLRQGFGLKTAAPRPRFRIEPHTSGYCPGIDRGRLNQMVDELAADEFGGKAR